MWAIGRFDLGIPLDEFGRSNLKFFDAMMERKQAARREADYRAGVLATLIYSSIPAKKKRQVRPDTWFPSLKETGGGE